MTQETNKSFALKVKFCRVKRSLSYDSASLVSLQWSEQIQCLFGLFLVPTPLGHLEDITLRGLKTLEKVQGILCEDTRKTRLLLDHYGITTPCYAYHRHNEKARLPFFIERLQGGEKLALVSDRGTPLISDPGFLLVQACYEQGIAVHGLPGPSSVTLAVMLCGIPCSSFFFQGFLPFRKKTPVLRRLASLPVPIVFFESPHRLIPFLESLLLFFGPRRACLMREMTKKFEERWEGSLDELLRWAQNKKAMGEYVLVVEGLLEKNSSSKQKYSV